MKPREQKILMIVGGVLGLFLVYYVMNAVLIAPMRDLNDRIAKAQADNDRLQEENDREISYLKRLRDYTGQTFDASDTKVMESNRARLEELLGASGLADENLSLQPVTGPLVPGNFKSLGWSITARGKLAKVVNFLYLVDADPRVHRIEGLTIRPLTHGEVDMQLKYLTMVIDPVKGQKPFPGPTTLPAPDLKTQLRGEYQLIAVRDLFRPYVPRPPWMPTPWGETPPSVAQTSPNPDTQATTLPAESEQARFKVVGLPSWLDMQQVIISDKTTGQAYYFKPGDEIIGGRIAMVDYRPFSRRDQPLINTTSRVIIVIGGEFYGVELGQTLADRVKVDPIDLPPQLVSSVQSVHTSTAPSAVTAPATGSGVGTSTEPASGSTSRPDSTPASPKADNH